MTLLECILWGGGTGLAVSFLALLVAYWPTKPGTAVVSYARLEASNIVRNVEELLAIGATSDQLRRAIRSLEDFERVVVCFHDGRRLPSDHAELLAAIRAGIVRLRGHVAMPVVVP